jgi:hypothetical protein
MRVANRPRKGGREVEKRLGQYLDDRFTLVHGARLPGRAGQVEAVLVGPHGVTALAFANDEGRVRCLGENWYIWSPKLNDFVDAGYSPAKQARADLAALQAYLAGRQLGATVPADCAVIQANPRSQIESMQPAVPIFMADQVDEMAQALAAQRELIEWTDADQVLKGLGVPPLGQPWARLSQLGAGKPSASPNRLGLTRQQTLILAVMAVADFIVLGLGALLLLR